VKKINKTNSRHIESIRKWQRAHPDKMKQYQTTYNEKHKAEVKERKHRYYLTHKSMFGVKEE
jgi:hypothetical protein